MKKESLLACALAMLVGVLTLFVATAAADQASGTWKMNTEKSKYSPGPPPKSLTVVVESDDTNYKIDATGTDADGKPIHVQYSATFDGKDYSVTGVAKADSVSVKRIDADAVETVQEKDGKVNDDHHQQSVQRRQDADLHVAW
jgi:hypothetical protein